MHDRPRRVLRQLVARHGSSLALDPRRTEALLSDLCGRHAREIFVLVHTQEIGLPAEMMAAGHRAGTPAHMDRLSQRIQQRLALAPEAAEWAVAAWAEALTVEPRESVWRRRLGHLAEFGRRLLPDQPPDGSAAVVPSAKQERAQQRHVSWSAAASAPQRLRAGWRRAVSGARFLWTEPPTVRPIAAALLMALTAVAIITAGPGLFARLGGETPPIADLQQNQQIQAALEKHFPLPRGARLVGEQIDLRAEPAADAPVLALIQSPGASITVSAFSEDAAWSLYEPDGTTAGWIANRHLAFSPQDEQSPRLDSDQQLAFVQPGWGRTSVSELRVRSGPSTLAAIRAALDVDETVLILAASEDERWYYLASPLPGWVSADYVQRTDPPES